MKNISTIKNKIKAIKKIADESPNGKRMHEAWVAYHTLRWVIEDIGGTVEKLLEPEVDQSERGA